MCGIAVTHRGRDVLSIKPDSDDVFSRGHICPKAVALQDYLTDPDRLRVPQIRDGDEYRDATWDEAIALTVSRIQEIQERFGRESFGVYLGNPNAHNHGNLLWIPRLYQALGTHNRYSSASADQLPHHVASQAMFGHGMLVPVPDIDHTDFLLIIGGNPVVSNGSMMSAPGMPRRLKEIQQRGGRFVVVDPRRTETAALADRHLFIRPESDAWLLLAILHEVFARNAQQLRHLGDIVDGLDVLPNIVGPYTPSVAARMTGISEEDIRWLAQQFIESPTAVCYSRMGASTQRFGGLCLWLTYVLNLTTGNMDREGGAMFTQPAFDLVEVRSQRGRPTSYGSRRSRVRGLPYFNGEFPVATLADEILTPGENQIRGLITIAGNPVLSSPNGERLNEAFANLDFMVSLDIYRNETTRHADVLLPAASGLAASHYDVVFHALAVRNTARFSAPMVERTEDERYDWEIIEAISSGLTGKASDTSPDAIVAKMIDHNPKYPDLTFEQVRSAPHGIDLGPLRPCLRHRLQTPDGRINLVPSVFVDDLTRLNGAGETPEDGQQMRLIARRVPRHHNTWTHNSYRLIKGRNQCTLQMHSRDAGDRKLETGDRVRVSNHCGEIVAELEITDDMMPGVVSLPQGWGDRSVTDMSIAASRPGVSINALTDHLRIDEATGNAAFNGIVVAVNKADAPAID